MVGHFRLQDLLLKPDRLFVERCRKSFISWSRLRCCPPTKVAHAVRPAMVFVAVMVGITAFGHVAWAGDVPQSFTLDGRLFSDPQGTVALADSSVVVKVQILDENKVCILYEETQSISTNASQGYFSIQVGSETGSIK